MFDPTLKTRRLKGHVEVRRDRRRISLLLVSFHALGRTVAFAPRFPQLWFDVPAEVSRSAFGLQTGGDAQRAFGGVVSAEGDYFVVVVNEIIDGKLAASDDAILNSKRQGLISEQGRAEFAGITEALRARVGVKLSETSSE